MEDINSEVGAGVNCIDSICRACLCDLKEAIAFNINDFLVQKREDTRETTEMLAINDLLSKYASIEINKEDNLPKILCQQCLADLTYVHEFIKKCQKSDEILRKTSLNSNENVLWIKTEEPDEIPLKIEHDIIEENIDIKSEIEKKQLATAYCNYCDLQFKNLDEFREHKKTVKHPLPRNHECPQCRKKFRSPNLLAEHIRTHTKERPFSCNLCSATFNNKCNLRRHIVRHCGGKPREKQYNCEYCGKEFVKKQSLTIHLLSHTGERPHICNYCGKGFKQSWNMKAHIKNRHNPTPKSTAHSSEFECSICKRRLSSKQCLKAHEKIHKEKQHLCSQCGERFLTKYSLDVHYRVHTNEKPFACEYCDKSYKLKASLRSHVYTHTGESPYSCQVCHKSFKQMSHLRAHKQRQHQTEKPHVCNYCEKSFVVKGDLKVHERIHTGEMPYKCEICWKGFYSSGSRGAHMKIHGNTSEQIKEEKGDGIKEDNGDS